MDMRHITKAAKEQNWTIGVTKGGHPRFVPPNPTGKICTFSGTPGDVRAIRNFLADLRREGFVWPWPPKKGQKKGGS